MSEELTTVSEQTPGGGGPSRKILRLTSRAAAEILRRAGHSVDTVRSTCIKRANDVYRIQANGVTFFLKAHTKDWYSKDPLAGARESVRHENAAWQCLSRHSVPAPEVVAADSGTDNPLGWPYIVTVGMAGDPVTKWLGRSRREDFEAQLVVAGGYLAGAHSITFRHPGYFTTADGPTSPLPKTGWRHPVHDATAAQRTALGLHERESPQLSVQVRAEVERRLSRLAEVVASEYHPPRFVHGDFHAGHLWVRRERGSWTASGAVDMEVASGGAVFGDLSTFAVEMMARFHASTRWWEPFFFGYGKVPDLDRFRLALLATGEPSLRCHGQARWPATMNATRRALLSANRWSELFDANHAAD